MENEEKPSRWKKWRRITFRFLLFSTLFFGLLFFMLSLSSVQTYLAKKASNFIFEKYQIKTNIEHVLITFPYNVDLGEVYIEGDFNDTLLYVENVTLKLPSPHRLGRRLKIADLVLQSPKINLYFNQTSQSWNYRTIDSLINAGPKSSGKSYPIYINSILLTDGFFNFSKSEPTKTAYFNPNNFAFRNINISVSNIIQKKENLSLVVHNIALRDDFFRLDTLKFSIKGEANSYELNKFKLQSANSKILLSALFSDEDFQDDFYYKADFASSSISTNEVEYFIGERLDLASHSYINGSLAGSSKSIEGYDLSLYSYNLLDFKGNFKLENFNKIENIKYELQTERLKVVLTEGNKYVDGLKLPKEIITLSPISFVGELKGTLEKLDAEGDFSTSAGNMSTLAFVDATGKIPVFSGEFHSSKFNLEQILPGQPLKELGFHGEIKGFGNKIDNLDVIVKGEIPFLRFENNLISKVELDGNMKKKLFIGSANCSDPNLNFKLNGNISFLEKEPRIDIKSSINYINLQHLGLSKNPSAIKGKIEICASGDDLDNFQGAISGSDLMYEETGKSISTSFFEFNSNKYSDSMRYVYFNSDLATGLLNGKFDFTGLGYAFENYLNNYLPSYFKSKSKFDDYSLNGKIIVKNTDQIARFIDQERFKSTPIVLNVDFSGADKSLKLITKIDTLWNDNLIIKDFSFNTASNETNLLVNVSSNEVFLNDSVVLKKLILNNSINNEVNWFNYSIVNQENANQALLNGTLRMDSSRALLQFESSSLTLDSNIWEFVQEQPIVIKENYYSVSNFLLKHENQNILVDGIVSTNPLDTLNFRVADFENDQLNPLLASVQTQVFGTTNIKLKGTNLLKSPEFFAELDIDNLKIDSLLFGNVVIQTDWNQARNIAFVEGTIFNAIDTSGIALSGVLDLHKGNEEMDFDFKLNKTDIRILNKVLAPDIRELTGTASGFLKVIGTPNKPILIGYAQAKDLSMLVDFTNVRYNTNGQIVNILLSEDYIKLDKIKLYDDYNGYGILDGKIKHKYFRNTTFDLNITIPEKSEQSNFYQNKLLVYNKPIGTIDDDFYGIAYAVGSASLKGHVSKLKMKIAAKTEPGTEMKIPLEDSYSTSQHDFVHFISKKSTPIDSLRRLINLEGISLELDITATDDAIVSMIFDEVAGDIIKGTGNGRILIDIDIDGNMQMFGNYKIKEGSYLFTFENLLNKKFEVKEGGTVTWTGDPYNALINLKAVYNLRAYLNPLFPAQVQSNSSLLQQGELNVRYPIECYLIMTGTLLNPIINFEIKIPNLPAGSLAAIKLNDINSNSQELANQVFGLLMFSQFIGQGDFTAGISGGGVHSVSELISNQISNWLSRYSQNINIGVNYYGSGKVESIDGTQTAARRQLQLALNTSLFNNRVVLDGNLDVGSDFVSSQNQQVFGGNFKAEFLVDDKGNLRVVAFNKLENNLLFNAGANYRQGIGVKYRKEFDTFGELFREIFKRKKPKEKS